MAITPRNCTDNPTFTPKTGGDCDKPESAYIQGLFFWKLGLDLNSLLAPDDSPDLTAWQTAITAGDIEVIPECSGTWQEGEANTIKAFGSRPDRNNGFNFTQTIEVDGAINNLDYWHRKNNSTSWGCGFVFDNGKSFVLFKGKDQGGNLIPSPITITAQPMSEGDGDSAFLYTKVEIKTSRAELPYTLNVPLQLFSK